MKRPIRVLISYTHDSQEHKDRVLGLSYKLRERGVDCHIDQYEESPEQGWPQWMVDQIEQADFVLIVCTERYNLRFNRRDEAGKGKGAKWEGLVITQELYNKEGKNKKFIPILFSSKDEVNIPIVLQGATYYSPLSKDQFQLLYRRLTAQPSIVKPPLGNVISLQAERIAASEFNLSDDAFSGSSTSSAREQASQSILENVPGNDGASGNASCVPHELTDEITGPDEIVAVDLPPLVENPAPRKNAVKTILELSEKFSLVFISGTSGSGKTHLALLAAIKLECIAWLRFRDLSEADALARLESGLVQISGCVRTADTTLFYQNVAKSVKRGCVIVLDDLPRISQSSELFDRLVLLVRALGGSGVRIISTSVHFPPSLFEASVGQLLLHVTQVPAFEVDDAAHLLKSLGATDQFCTSSRVSFINVLTKGHPVLLAAAGRFLSRQGWRFSERELDGLFRSDYTTEIVTEIRLRLMQVVSADARDALYRLNLIGAEFSEKDLEILAEVPPRVPRPKEQLAALLGYCVQRETVTTMSVSPVFQVLGATDISLDTQKACHLALANRLLEPRKIDVISGVRAIRHLVSAGEMNHAGMVLLSGLHYFLRRKKRVPDYGLLSIWIDLPLPAAMSLGIRFQIRALQTAALKKEGREIKFVLDDLSKLAKVAREDDALFVVLGMLDVGDVIAQSDFQHACDLWGRVIGLMESLRTSHQPRMRLAKGYEAETLLWTLTRHIESAEHQRAWIKAVDELTPKQRDSLFANEDGRQFSLSLSSQLWYVQLRNGNSPDWLAVKDAVVDLGRAARRWNCELLWAGAVRTELIVLGENLKDIEKCVSRGLEAIQEASADPLILFLLEEELGSQLSHAKREMEATPWFEKAFGRAVNEFRIPRFYGHLTFAHVLDGKEPNEVVRQVEAAVKLGMETSHREPLPGLELVKAFGELAIAHQRNGNMKASFLAADEAARRLFALKDDSASWKDLFVVFAHVCGFLSTFARTRLAPIAASDGGEYAAPFVGVFSTNNAERAGRYKPENDTNLAAMLTFFAEAVDDSRNAARWAEATILKSRGIGSSDHIIPLVASSLVCEMLQMGRFDEAFALETESSNLTAAGTRLWKAGRTADPAIDVKTVLGPRDDVEWLNAERHAMICVCIPLAAELANRILSDEKNGVDRTKEAVAALDRFAATTLDPIAWQGVRKALEVGLLKTAGEPLIKFGNSFDQNTRKATGCVAYICSTMHDRGDLRQAIEAHGAIMPFLDTFFASYPTGHLIIADFFEHYWDDAIHRMPFSFSAPNEVRRILDDSKKLTKSERVRSIFSTVSASLGVHFPQNVKHWLSTGKMFEASN